MASSAAVGLPNITIVGTQRRAALGLGLSRASPGGNILRAQKIVVDRRSKDASYTRIGRCPRGSEPCQV